MLKLEDLQGDTHVSSIEPSGVVEILYIKRAGLDAADVTYELLNGAVLEKTFFRSELKPTAAWESYDDDDLDEEPDRRGAGRGPRRRAGAAHAHLSGACLWP